MNCIDETIDGEHLRSREIDAARNRRMLNNLPLAHRLASSRAIDPVERGYLLGQALVGLVAAVDSFDRAGVDCRFGAYAGVHIAWALEQARDADEVAAAQAQIAEAISTRARAQELADFFGVTAEAIVGDRMDARAPERAFSRRRPMSRAAGAP